MSAKSAKELHGPMAGEHERDYNSGCGENYVLEVGHGCGPLFAVFSLRGSHMSYVLSPIAVPFLPRLIRYLAHFDAAHSDVGPVRELPLGGLEQARNLDGKTWKQLGVVQGSVIPAANDAGQTVYIHFAMFGEDQPNTR